MEDRRIIISYLKKWVDSKEARKIEFSILKSCKRTNKDDFESFYKETAFQKLGHIREQIKLGCEIEKIILEIENDVPEWNCSVYDEINKKINSEKEQTIAGVKIEKGDFNCKNRKCKSNECYFFSSQNRSCDEATSVYVVCTKCGKRYQIK